MQNRVQRQTRIKKTPLFVLLAMIFIVLGIIVMVFMNFMKENNNPNSPHSPDFVAASSNASSDASSDAASDTASVPVPQPIDPVSSESAVSSEDPIYVATKEVQVATIIPETIPVGNDYFKDAIFIGDSILKGFRISNVLPGATILADQNVGLDQIHNNKDVYYLSAKEKTTLWKAIEKKLPNPKKIYILLGSNGIPGYENKQHMVFYADLLDKLKEKYPEAIIYVQSTTPITKNSEYIRKTFSTAKINDFNKQLLSLAEEKGVYYLQIENALKDKNGYLKAEYAADDGMHMVRTGHIAMSDYYKGHTATKEGVAIVIDKDSNGGE